MFAREVVPSSKMSGLQIYRPLFDENEKYRSFTAQLDIDITVQELSPKQVIKDADGIFKLLSNHPMPYYQGPFLCPIGMKMLGKSFGCFTTFKHPDGVNCLSCNINAKNLAQNRSRSSFC